MKKAFRSKYIPWVCVLLLAALFTAVAYALMFVTPMKTVETGSMVPTLPVGSRILIHEQASYRVGDIITFHADGGKIVTHRLVKVANDGSLTTKGDANPTLDMWDKPVQKSAVVGKVIYMTPITTLAFWQSPLGLGIFASFFIVAFACLLWRIDDDELDTVKTKEENSSFHPV